MEATQVMEEAAEVAEKALDLVTESCPYTPRQHLPHILVLGAIGGIAGGLLGHYIGAKRTALKYEDILQEEIQQAKEFYRTLHKGEGLETPEAAMKTLHEPELHEAAEALVQYQGKIDNGEVVTEELVTVVTHETEDDDFDYEDRDPDKPYIIHHDEFFHNEDGLTQLPFTYYRGDGTLADERDKEVPMIDEVVGTDNLNRFGYGSGDDRTLYVRNERLGTEFEISLNDGKYAHIVLGLTHSDSFSRMKRRSRGFEDEDS